MLQYDDISTQLILIMTRILKFIGKIYTSYQLNAKMDGSVDALRAALHYSGEVYRSVKSFSPRHGYLRQGTVCCRR